MKTNPNPDLQTTEQIAVTLKRGPSTIISAIRKHRIKPARVEKAPANGRPRKLYDLAEVEACLPGREQLTPTKEAIEQEKLRKLKIDNDRRERVLIPRVDVIRVLSGIEGATKRDLKRMLVDEYPAEVIGLTVDKARVYGQRTFDRICEMFQKEQQHQWGH